MADKKLKERLVSAFGKLNDAIANAERVCVDYDFVDVNLAHGFANDMLGSATEILGDNKEAKTARKQGLRLGADVQAEGYKQLETARDKIMGWASVIKDNSSFSFSDKGAVNAVSKCASDLYAVACEIRAKNQGLYARLTWADKVSSEPFDEQGYLNSIQDIITQQTLTTRAKVIMTSRYLQVQDGGEGIFSTENILKLLEDFGCNWSISSTQSIINDLEGEGNMDLHRSSSERPESEKLYTLTEEGQQKADRLIRTSNPEVATPLVR